MTPPQDLLGHAAEGDRDYALQELTAFYLSWLASLTVPVLNRPTPMGLAGRWLHASELVLLARAAGLPTPTWRQSADDAADAGYRSLAPPSAVTSQAIVLDEEVFGPPMPAATRRGCVALAKAVEARILGVDFFASAEDPWTFAHATPMPALQLGGPALVTHLAYVLRGRSYQ
jgi:hypothetical protein